MSREAYKKTKSSQQLTERFRCNSKTGYARICVFSEDNKDLVGHKINNTFFARSALDRLKAYKHTLTILAAFKKAKPEVKRLESKDCCERLFNLTIGMFFDEACNRVIENDDVVQITFDDNSKIYGEIFVGKILENTSVKAEFSETKSYKQRSLLRTVRMNMLGKHLNVYTPMSLSNKLKAKLTEGFQYKLTR